MGFERIPAELQAIPQWVGWRVEMRTNGRGEQRSTKVPINTATGGYASVTKPETWGTFRAVCDAVGKHGILGIGMVFSAGDPFAGIDIDDADGDAAILAAHNKVIAAFPSYTELSPSGKGLHIIVRGTVEGSRKHGVEAYSKERYFTFTGNVWRDLPIIDCQPMLTELQAELAPSRKLHALLSTSPQVDSDDVIIARMLSANNADKVRQLVQGIATGVGDGSGSAVDMALVNVIQFYTKNVDQIERLWLSTPHAQDKRRQRKLQRLDYRMRTIRQAFDREVAPVDLAGLHAGWAAEAAAKAVSGSPAAPPHSLVTHPALSPSPGLDTASSRTGSPHASQAPSGISQTATPAQPLQMPLAKVNPHLLPPGLMGDVARYLYDAAPRQVPEIALAGAIGWMAGVCGRAYNIHGAGLNLYIALLASSGSGKEAISDGYAALQTAIAPSVPCIGDFIGPGNFASPQGLLRFVGSHTSAVSVIGEFGGWISDMVGDRANPVRAALKTALLELYGKSGKRGVFRGTIYSDKQNNIDAVMSPALSLVGETTPSTFYRSITQAVIEDGFLPRFILIEYEGKNQYINEQAVHVLPSAQLVADLAQLAGHALGLNAPAPNGGARVGPVAVGMAYDAKTRMDAFSRYCTDQSNATDNEGIKNVWARVYMNAAKLAALVAIGRNMTAPEITLAHVEWALTLVAHSVEKLTGKVDVGDVAGDLESKQHNDLMRCLLEITAYSEDKYGLVVADAQNHYINTAWLNRRISKLASYRNDRNGATRAVQRAVERALKEDVLFVGDQTGRGPGGTRYSVFMKHIKI